MILRFLGTGAADFSPLLETVFRDRLDPSVRRSSSVLIGENILVDCGLHTYDTMKLLGIDTSKITDLFLTHLHVDHYCPDGIVKLCSETEKPLRIHFRADAPVPEFPNAELCPIPLYETVSFGDLSVTALEANHDASVFPIHYYFEIDGERIFYGCDGGWMLNRAFRFLRAKKCTCLILDATVGEDPTNFRAAEHNSLPMLRILVPSLKTVGAADENTVIVLQHLGITLHEKQDAIEQSVSSYGWKVARDGMTLEI